MSSTITLRSRWNDKEWEPEDGSPLGRPMSYTLDGVKHYISRAEVEAGERVGIGTHLDYARCAHIAPPGRGGWEYFALRPGRTDSPAPDRTMMAWTALEVRRLRGLVEAGLPLHYMSVLLGRSETAVRLKIRNL